MAIPGALAQSKGLNLPKKKKEEVPQQAPTPTPSAIAQQAQIDAQRAEIQRKQPVASAIADQAQAKGVPLQALASKGELKKAGFGKQQTDFQALALQSATQALSPAQGQLPELSQIEAGIQPQPVIDPLAEIKAQRRKELDTLATGLGIASLATGTGGSVKLGGQVIKGLIGRAGSRLSGKGIGALGTLGIGAVGGGVGANVIEAGSDVTDLPNPFEFLSNSKPKEISQAEGAFQDSVNAINIIQEEVKAGRMSPIEGQIFFEQAVGAINRIESKVKQQGGINLGYWKDGGANMEATILSFRQQLGVLRNNLNLAQQEARLNEARLNAGLQPGA